LVHTDARFSAAIERAVGEIEGRTDAELVVVAAPASGSYADIAWIVASAVGAVVLAFLCWSPIVFDAMWFPLDIAATVGLTAAALTRWPRLAARLAGRDRRDRQVREAALAAFTEENVHATARRTGVLVYVSALEGRVELLPDQGLLGRIPGAKWNAVALRAGDLDELLAGLHRLGALLATDAPPAGVNADQIPNAPRVRA
jgi:putative membrane protein